MNGEERMNRRARLRGYMMASSHLHSSLKAIHCIGIVAILGMERGASLFAKIPIRRIGFPPRRNLKLNRGHAPFSTHETAPIA